MFSQGEATFGRGPLSAGAILVTLVACQGIAGLTIPTYVTPDGGLGGASTTSTTSGSGGHVATDAGKTVVATGDGGPCTVGTDPSLPPCLEHLQLWLDANEGALFEFEQGYVTTWRDRSSFGWTATADPIARVTRQPVSGVSGSYYVTFGAGSGMTLDAHSRALSLPAVSLYAVAQMTEPPPALPPTASGILNSTVTFLDLCGTTTGPELVWSNSLDVSDAGFPDFTLLGLASGSQQRLLLGQVPPTSDAFEEHLYIYGFQHSCDATCAQTDAPDASMEALTFSAATSAGLAGTGPEGGPPDNVTLDQAFYPSWNGVWSSVGLAQHCTAVHSNAFVPYAQLGEVLLYDTFLDATSIQALQQYLTTRWGAL